MGKLISLDFDDVIYDLMELNINYIDTMHGIPDIDKQIEHYYWLYQTFPDIGDNLWNNPDNYIKGRLVSGAKEFYDKLVELIGEDNIQIVTSSMPDVVEKKNIMIKEFGFNCDIIHSIFGVHPKHHYTKNTILIDDAIGNIIDHVGHNQCYGILFNHRRLDYIKKANDGMSYPYVETYDDVLYIIKRRLINEKEISIHKRDRGLL